MNFDAALELAKKQSRIILPPVIDGDTYEQIMQLMMIAREESNRPIELYCAGYGGQSDLGFGIIDWITADGSVEGYLMGKAYSTHAIIWAACPKRYIYSNSVMAIHRVQLNDINNIDQNTAHQMYNSLRYTDNRMAEVLAHASNKSLKYWKEKLATGSNYSAPIDATGLMSLDMGDFVI